MDVAENKARRIATVVEHIPAIGLGMVLYLGQDMGLGGMAVHTEIIIVADIRSGISGPQHVDQQTLFQHLHPVELGGDDGSRGWHGGCRLIMLAFEVDAQLVGLARLPFHG